MKISIDTDVLARHKLTLGEFLTLLLSYYNVHYTNIQWDIIGKDLAQKDWTDNNNIVLSDNSKNLVARILIESDPKLNKSPVKDFYALAGELMNIYPEGHKQGTTYLWSGTLEEIAQKLMVLVVVHDFIYTEEEAINAVKQYVDSFKDDRTHMKLLKYFLLRTKNREISSDFMTIIENNRDENKRVNK